MDSTWLTRGVATNVKLHRASRWHLFTATAMLLGPVVGCGPSASTTPPTVTQTTSVVNDATSSSPTKDRSAAEKADPEATKAPLETADAAPDAGARGGDAAEAGDELSSARFVLFLPAGPLVVELRMTIDGQPFGAAREELIDQALKLADRDHDGRATWSEVFSDPKRVFAQRFDLGMNMANRKELLKTNDTNQNGLVDRDEARRLVARAKSAGAAFSLESSSEYRHSNQRQSIVRAMLDANGDDVLDEAELNNAEQRLSARDADDDHILTWSELDDSLAGDEQAMTSRQNAYLNHPAALVLGERADWDGIVYTLSEFYLNDGRPLEESFGLAPSLAAALDEDHDGQLSFEELRRLNLVEPQVILAANFGKPGEFVVGVALLRLSPDLGPADRVVSHTPRGLVLALEGYRLQIVLDDRAPANDVETSPDEQLAQLDKDKNGYLEKEEFPGASPDTALMFDEADANGDGKVYRDELAAYRRSQRAPRLSAIRAVASDDQDVLFPLLDSNQDSRLTTRELHAARQALGALDADGDGRISLDELPGGLTVWLGRGLPSDMSPRRSMFASLPVAAPPSGPAWFAHMDSNHDQEISLEEFPGSGEKFRSLDLDGDGFVSASEAQSAVR